MCHFNNILALPHGAGVESLEPRLSRTGWGVEL